MKTMLLFVMLFVMVGLASAQTEEAQAQPEWCKDHNGCTAVESDSKGPMQSLINAHKPSALYMELRKANGDIIKLSDIHTMRGVWWLPNDVNAETTKQTERFTEFETSEIAWWTSRQAQKIETGERNQVTRETPKTPVTPVKVTAAPAAPATPGQINPVTPTQSDGEAAPSLSIDVLAPCANPVSVVVNNIPVAECDDGDNQQSDSNPTPAEEKHGFVFMLKSASDFRLFAIILFGSAVAALICLANLAMTFRSDYRPHIFSFISYYMQHVNERFIQKTLERITETAEANSLATAASNLSVMPQATPDTFADEIVAAILGGGVHFFRSRTWRTNTTKVDGQCVVPVMATCTKQDSSRFQAYLEKVIELRGWKLVVAELNPGDTEPMSTFKVSCACHAQLNHTTVSGRAWAQKRALK